MLLYDPQKAEQDVLEKEIRDAIAYLGDESCKLHRCATGKELRALLDVGNLLDLGCLDVTEKGGVEHAAAVRRAYPEMEIMLIADASMSPLTYIKPGIRAASLLLRPFARADAEEILREFLGAYLHSLREEEDQVLLLKSRDGVIRLPYRQICYIEARMKKIFLRTETEEFGYYDTLERLLESLPETFVRCHRGYIVNLARVLRLDAAENLLVLDNGMEIPVSRNCKAALKNQWK